MIQYFMRFNNNSQMFTFLLKPLLFDSSRGCHCEKKTTLNSMDMYTAALNVQDRSTSQVSMYNQ